ncbi:carbohydrate kinase [candidate division KSB1 bacterium]|nr:carbohydrate kinase [candidate division KSB1 bacterium]RQW01510.1 MAG: carbohydrate kinase [candidate division KSB1 bacterium]
MKREQLESILDAVHNVDIAVYGDFCLDAYWILDPRGGEISVETSLQSEAVRRQYYSLGGASNVVANLAALQPRSIRVVGVIGDDIFGREMVGQFHALKVDTGRLISQKKDYDTVVFSKRYLNDVEQPRIDFGFFNTRSRETDEAIIDHLKSVLQFCDALIFNQQVPGCLSPYFIDKANEIFAACTDKIILLDSRHYGKRFSNIYRKINAREAAQLADWQADDEISSRQLEEFGLALFQQERKPVFLTRGDRGIQAFDRSGVTTIPGIHFLKKLDTVGAGDTVISALAAALAAGFSPAIAAEFANLAAGVTVQKRFQTGTASGEEIVALNREVYFLHQPELAHDLRKAVFIDHTDIEACTDLDSLDRGKISYVIFDHDGTISTLREGWAEVMEKVMLECILGDHKGSVDVAEYKRIRAHVREFIDMTTGIQTILQMESLVEMVKEFGHVPPDQIGDKFAYKKIFNAALMHVVDRRAERIRSGELNPDDYTIKGAVAFLHLLSSLEMKLYLASGTDHEDVLREADLLGYASLFDGGIYGAAGDVSRFSKRVLIEKIIRDHNLSGPELAVFGDGPVEMQECRKYGGIAIGVASDEVRRFGLNVEKRTRLIQSGAHFIIPDYSQGNSLLNFLFSPVVDAG